MNEHFDICSYPFPAIDNFAELQGGLTAHLNGRPFSFYKTYTLA